MLEDDFKTEVLETEIVVAHSESGHIFRFLLLSNGNVSIRGSKIKANPSVARQASRFVFGAYGAALAALIRSRA
jgi:hypothetical protein